MEVVALLSNKRAQLDKLAEALLEHEMWTRMTHTSAGVEHGPSESSRDLAAAAQVTTA